MKYKSMVTAAFISRPNRFIAYADYNGQKVMCHVKNTGRCRELLIPGASVYLQYHPDAALTGRKTEYSLISVKKEMPYGEELVNLDSQAPNTVAYEWLMSRGFQVHREVTYGKSRFDLAFEEDNIPTFMEVKGVTLEEHGIARFPDAPTERGIKHLQELERAVKEGYRAYVLFVIAMKGIRTFEPNRARHPEFADALAHAAAHGVRILAYDCIVTRDSLTIHHPVPVNLQV
ncbi:MAG: DNA/RNA nuclease SfsA [Brotaphodocola sp.]